MHILGVTHIPYPSDRQIGLVSITQHWCVTDMSYCWSLMNTWELRGWSGCNCMKFIQRSTTTTVLLADIQGKVEYCYVKAFTCTEVRHHPSPSHDLHAFIPIDHPCRIEARVIKRRCTYCAMPYMRCITPVNTYSSIMHTSHVPNFFVRAYLRACTVTTSMCTLATWARNTLLNTVMCARPCDVQ